MPVFLSTEWVDAASGILAGVDPIEGGVAGDTGAGAGTEASGDVGGGAAPPAQALGVLELVTGGPGGDLALFVTLGGGRMQLSLAPDPRETEKRADVSLRITWDDAVSLARGELEVMDALAGGRVKVRGSLPHLARYKELLDRTREALAPLYSETTYG